MKINFFKKLFSKKIKTKIKPLKITEQLQLKESISNENVQITNNLNRYQNQYNNALSINNTRQYEIFNTINDSNKTGIRLIISFHYLPLILIPNLKFLMFYQCLWLSIPTSILLYNYSNRLFTLSDTIKNKLIKKIFIKAIGNVILMFITLNSLVFAYKSTLISPFFLCILSIINGISIILTINPIELSDITKNKVFFIDLNGNFRRVIQLFFLFGLFIAFKEGFSHKSHFSSKQLNNIVYDDVNYNIINDGLIPKISLFHREVKFISNEINLVS